MFCSKCGKECSANDMFCPGCGNNLSNNAQTVNVSEPELNVTAQNGKVKKRGRVAAIILLVIGAWTVLAGISYILGVVKGDLYDIVMNMSIGVLFCGYGVLMLAKELRKYGLAKRSRQTIFTRASVH